MSRRAAKISVDDLLTNVNNEPPTTKRTKNSTSWLSNAKTTTTPPSESLQVPDPLQNPISTTALALAKPRKVVKPTKSKHSKKADENDIEEQYVLLHPTSIDQVPQSVLKMVRQYELVKAMRSSYPETPVDTMGSAKAGNRQAAPEVFRFETLVALMLSSQTKDAVTYTAVKSLRERLQFGCTPRGILHQPELAHDCIKSVGFHNTKIKNLIKVSEICQNQYNHDIPPTIDELLDLPGVGPKMGHLVMSCAWGEITGVAIDVHLQRILNLTLKWFSPPLPTPEKTRTAIEQILPKKHWEEINPIFVGFGQTICPSQRPKCNSCSLSTLGLCPSLDASSATRMKLTSPLLHLIKLFKDNPDNVKIGMAISPDLGLPDDGSGINIDDPRYKLITVDDGVIDILTKYAHRDVSDPLCFEMLKKYVVTETLKIKWNINNQTILDFFDNTKPLKPFVGGIPSSNSNPAPKH